MSLRDWWRKVTGGSEPTPDTRQPEIQDPPSEAPSRPDDGEIDRRTLQDEEIL